MNRYYALTVRKVRQPVYLSHYSDLVELLEESEYLTESHYEEDKGLHIHVMLISTKEEDVDEAEVRQILHLPKYGWKVDISECRSIEAWDRYIKKDIKKEEDLIHREMIKEVLETCEVTEIDGQELEEPEQLSMEDVFEVLKDTEVPEVQVRKCLRDSLREQVFACQKARAQSLPIQN